METTYNQHAMDSAIRFFYGFSLVQREAGGNRPQALHIKHKAKALLSDLGIMCKDVADRLHAEQAVFPGFYPNICQFTLFQTI